MVAQRMRDYELVMVLSPERDEQQVEDAAQRVADFVTGAGGTVSEEEYWGLRRLAYPINEVLELDRMLKASEHVLRHLITKPDKSEKKA